MTVSWSFWCLLTIRQRISLQDMIRPEELMALWEKQHGTLQFRPKWRAEFLSRDEIFEIIEYPEKMIREALKQSRYLSEVLHVLQKAEQSSPRNREPFRAERPIAGTQPKRSWRDAEKERWKYRGKF